MTWPGPGYQAPEPRQFSPKDRRWWFKSAMVVLGLTLLFCLAVMVISAYPQTPPPHVDKYIAHQSEPLGPVTPQLLDDHAWAPEYLFEIPLEGTTEFLYGIHIDNLKGGDGDEIAIFVSEGWDCVLATEKDGCIIK